MNRFAPFRLLLAVAFAVATGASSAATYKLKANGNAFDTDGNWTPTLSGAKTALQNGTCEIVLSADNCASPQMPAHDVYVKSLGFSSYTWQALTLSANGSYKMKVGSGGIYTSIQQAYTINAPVVLMADQIWNLDKVNANCKYNLALGNTLTGNYKLIKNGRALLRLGASSGTFSWKTTEIRQGDVQLTGRNNFWPSGHTIVFANDNRDYPSRLNLAVDQIFRDVTWSTDPDSVNFANGLTTPGYADRHVAYLVGTLEDTRFAGTFEMGAGICWHPSSKKTLTLSGPHGDTQGDFIVSNGTMRVVDGYNLPDLNCIRIAGTGAKMEVGPVGTDLSALRLELWNVGSGALKLLDKTESGTYATPKDLTFAMVTVNGNSLAPGVYTSSSPGCNWLAGSGSITVTGRNWTGKATTTSVSQKKNWDAGSPDDLAGGTVAAVFATGGTEALLPANFWVKLLGIVFRGANDFTLTAEPDARVVDVGSDGLRTIAGTAARTYTVGWMLRPTFNQDWYLDGSDTLVLNGGLTGSSPITKNGTGTFRVNAPAEQTEPYEGTFTLNKGTTYVSGDAPLGVGTVNMNWSDSYLYLNNAALANHIVCNSMSAGGSHIMGVANTTNHIYGALDLTAGGNCGLGANAGGVLHVHGGVWGAGNFSPSNLIVDDKPLLLTDRLSGGSVLTLNVASNWFGGNTWLSGAEKLYCKVPYAMYRGPRMERPEWGTSAYTFYTHIDFANRANQLVDLGGFNQEVSGLCAYSTYASSSAIHSDKPAQLEIYHDLTHTSSGEWDSRVNYYTNSYMRFTGAAGLSVKCFSGASPKYTQAISLNISSPTTGKLEVAVDEDCSRSLDTDMLIMKPAVQWLNASEVSVSCGTLKLQRKDTFGSQVVINVTSNAAWRQGGRLRLDFTGVQPCSKLVLNGIRQRTGTYGAPGSGAQYIDNTGRLTGTGILNVVGDGSQRSIFHFK